MTLEQLLSELNEQQRMAVTTDQAHCLVLAGAGCGKTKTIISRAAYLIAQGLPARNVQILTFTRRAASEIVTRVEQYLGESAQGLRASTFHTFCISLLRRHSKALGLGQFTVIDRDDQVMIFRLLRGKGKDNALPKAAQLCDIYSFARNTRCKLSEAIEKLLPEVINQKQQIAEVMKAYEVRKHRSGFFDYDDILAVVATHLHQSPAFLASVVQQHHVFLVDEMQDTNPLQWAILEPLISHSQIFCVGDDAQSIYGFRGADFENIHRFKSHVPNATVYKLEKNYRSTQQILDVSNWLLGQSEIAYNKSLVAHRKTQSTPQFHLFSNEFEEASWIAQDIYTRHHDNNTSWHEHMVLVRSAYAARHIERAFIAMSIPYRFIGGAKLLESAHVKDVLSMLRVVINVKDDIAWMRFLTLWNGIGDVGASKIALHMNTYTSLTECCDYLASKVNKIPTQAVDGLRQLADLTTQVETCMVLAVGLLTAQLEEKYQQDWSKRQKDFKLVEQLASKHQHLAQFLEEYVLEPISIADVKQAIVEDIVTLTTIHSAKGLEENVCYVPHLSVGFYPHARTQGDFDAVEEERRVLYVALTRARHELILTKHESVSWSYDLQDDQGRHVSGYFLNDFPSDLVDVKVHQRTSMNHGLQKASANGVKKISFDLDLD
ncbi:ATP-dependent helicase [Acinetobacter boissieri]|uniref:DNA 3'-5' helicase n=1 Tax=Acinetobacter boissieri TaxID=1219383 RepID=A0A1G6HVX3_9GAMM|nr:ATP-dependent helicase [Acinetobacter boissieri]SDB98293.1 DNA helicase-2 / ATP-dependent DNA helicase PcrA [Acinetobacter boissieri]